MKARSIIDVSRLPTIGFGPQAPLWWGQVGLVAIERRDVVHEVTTLRRWVDVARRVDRAHVEGVRALRRLPVGDPA